MLRLPPALPLVLLVVVSVPAVALAGPPPAAAGPGDTHPSTGTAGVAVQESQPANTSRLLLLDDVQAANVTRPERDLATTLSMQGSELDGRFASESLRVRLASLDDEEARRNLLLNETARLQRTVDAMLAAERRARQQYVAGERSAAAYVRTLARLDAGARAVDRSLDLVVDFHVSEGGTALQRRIGLIQADLVVLEGTINDRIVSVVRGEAPPFSLAVAASTNGVVLSTVDADEYVREAYRADHVPEGSSRPGLDGALDVMKAFYPYARGEDNRNLTGSTPLGVTAWEMGLRHSHGRLTTYFYGNASEPYRETQFKSLGDYPFESSEETFSNDLVLTVNRTYAGGPLEVRLTNGSGTPLDGEVRVNGTVAGETGDDGTLWLLQPPREFTVAVVHDGERLSMDFGPTGARIDADASG